MNRAGRSIAYHAVMKDNQGITRRDMFHAAAGGLAGLSWSATASAKDATGPATTQPSARPKNIIFLVSDGMSMGVPSLAEPFAKLHRGRPTRLWQLLRAGGTTLGWFDMTSANSLVTDSAAAATSWGGGQRVNNGAINVTPDGQRLEPIARRCQAAGKPVGLVTTTRITHATPAGFAAVHPNRHAEDAIATQYLGEVDVLLGGGRRHFDANQRSDGRDLRQVYAEAGYTVIDDRLALERYDNQSRCLGLFSDSHMPYVLDWRQDPQLQRAVPRLPAMTRCALNQLQGRSEGFLLQVEAGRVDHAAHANDAAAILHEQLEFDDAVAEALAFAEGDGETLVVVTSDHGNANPGLNGIGGGYVDTTASFKQVLKTTASFDQILPQLRELKSDQQTPAKVRKVVHQHTDIALSDAEATQLLNVLKDNGYDELNQQHHNLRGVLGQCLGNHHGIQWTGTSHTADLPMIAAVGPGQDAFAGLLRNTDAYDRLTELMNVSA
jgi:alkaline phosphatase